MWLSYPTLRSFRLLFKSKQCLRDSLINLTLFVRVALIDWKLWYSVNMYHPKELAHYKSFCKYLLHLVSSRVWLYGNYSITKIIIAKKFSTLGKYVVYFHIMSVDLVAWFLNSASCNTFSCINPIVLYRGVWHDKWLHLGSHMVYTVCHQKFISVFLLPQMICRE